MVAAWKPVKHGATYADLAALPDDVLGQIVGGELYVTPRPAVAHSLTASTIGMDVGSPFQRGRGGPGGWWILDEPELHLGSDVLVPDLAGWRRERMPAPPRDAAVELAPDWVCEVLSPSTQYLDRGPKLEAYLRAGVVHAWIVDPIAQTLEVMHHDGAGAWRLAGVHRADARARIPPFDAVELDLSDWWAADPSPAG